MFNALPPNCLPSCLATGTLPTAHCPLPDRSILSLALKMERREGRSHPDPPLCFLSRSCPASQRAFLIRPHPPSISYFPVLSTSLSSPLSSLRHPILSFPLLIIYSRQTEFQIISVLLSLLLTHPSLASFSQPDSGCRFGLSRCSPRPPDRI